MKKYHKIFVITLIYIFCIGILIYNVFINTNELTKIEKAIKKHNSIKDSWTNVKHPTVPKPASSQSTVIYGDSVRVIPKINK
jgi:hypothetical protein